jgi:aminotransferase
VGWVLASADLTDSIRKVHDFLTVGAAAPLQQAGVAALRFGDDYYENLSREYAGKRDHILETLTAAGLEPLTPRGAYYVMAGIQRLGRGGDQSVVRHLIETLGVAAVPGSSFYARTGGGTRFIRFCFCKKYETLEEARRHFLKLTVD